MNGSIRQIAATLAVSALALAGCSGSSKTSDSDVVPVDSDKAVTLTFMHRWPEEAFAPYFQAVAAEYTKAHPNVKIDIQAVGNAQYKDKLTLLTRQKQLPDVFWATPGYLFTDQYVKAGLLENLKDPLSKDGWGDSINAFALGDYTNKDGVWGVPLQSNYKSLAYNPALFAKAGAKVPTTLDELFSACSKLKAAGVTPIGFGDAEGWPASHFMTSLNAYYVSKQTRDADYNSSPKPGAWSDPGYVKALDAFKKIQKECFANGAATSSFDAGRASFVNGQSAMYQIGTSEFKLVNDKLNKAAFSQSWSVMNMPRPADATGDLDSIAGNGNGVVVKKGPNSAIATDFVRFMTNKEYAGKAPTQLGWISSVKAVNTPDVTTKQGQDLISVAAKAKSVALVLDIALPAKVSAAYLSSLEGFLGGQLSSEDVLSTLRKTQP